MSNEAQFEEQFVRITDEKGKCVLDPEDNHPPYASSIVMVDAPFGTAWQRWYSDGRWHSAHTPDVTHNWGWFLQQKNVFLMYDAERRPVQQTVARRG